MAWGESSGLQSLRRLAPAFNTAAMDTCNQASFRPTPTSLARRSSGRYLDRCAGVRTRSASKVESAGGDNLVLAQNIMSRGLNDIRQQIHRLSHYCSGKFRACGSSSRSLPLSDLTYLALTYIEQHRSNQTRHGSKETATATGIRTHFDELRLSSLGLDALANQADDHARQRQTSRAQNFLRAACLPKP